MGDIFTAKAQLRKKILAQRLLLTENEYNALSDLAQIRFLESSYFKNSRNIMIYSPVKREVDTSLIAKETIKKGKNLFLPRIIGWKETMEAAEVNYYPKELILGSYNIPEPHPRAKSISPKQLDIIITPGLAFDKYLNRMGYGKKFYDNYFLTISSKTIKIGLSFELQIVDKVPTGVGDIQLDIIITEKRMIMK